MIICNKHPTIEPTDVNLRLTFSATVCEYFIEEIVTRENLVILLYSGILFLQDYPEHSKHVKSVRNETNLNIEIVYGKLFYLESLFLAFHCLIRLVDTATITIT